MTQVINKHQAYADLLGIEANQIDDVWLEIDNALFIDLASDASICINHSCNYYDDFGTTVYSALEVKQATIIDIDYIEFNYPISKGQALKVLNTYFESTWGTTNEHISADSYNEQAEADKAWLETCQDTARWLRS